MTITEAERRQNEFIDKLDKLRSRKLKKERERITRKRYLENAGIYAEARVKIIRSFIKFDFNTYFAYIKAAHPYSSLPASCSVDGLAGPIK